MQTGSHAHTTGDGEIYLQSALDEIFLLAINSELFFPRACNLSNPKCFAQKWHPRKSYFQEHVLQIIMREVHSPSSPGKTKLLSQGQSQAGAQGPSASLWEGRSSNPSHPAEHAWAQNKV